MNWNFVCIYVKLTFSFLEKYEILCYLKDLEYISFLKSIFLLGQWQEIPASHSSDVSKHLGTQGEYLYAFEPLFVAFESPFISFMTLNYVLLELFFLPYIQWKMICMSKYGLGCVRNVIKALSKPWKLRTHFMILLKCIWTI